MTDASLAERLTWGTPLAPADGETPIHVVPRAKWMLAGRLLLAGIFLVNGAAKLADVQGTATYMTGAGIPYATTLAVIAGLAEILGGLSLVTGFLARLGALGLILFLVPTTFLFHDFWNFAGQERAAQLANFLKNLSIMGGLAFVVANGAGPLSLDGRIRRPMQA